jgi:hypothetical protein
MQVQAHVEQTRAQTARRLRPGAAARPSAILRRGGRAGAVAALGFVKAGEHDFLERSRAQRPGGRGRR